MNDIEPTSTATTPPADVDRSALSVIIPAYNEEGSLSETVDEIREALDPSGILYEIIVVDDGSEDATRQKALDAGVTVVTNPENRGYGASLKRGIARSKHDFVAIIDADATYPPRYLPEMFALAQEADMVVGDRGAAMKNVPLIRRPAKRILNGLAEFLAERKLNDLNSGLRVLRKSAAVPFFPLLPSGFSFTTTITLCMACTDQRLIYVPIEYRKRVGDSKIRPAHFINFIVLVLRAIMLFNPLRIFLPLGLGFFIVGLAKAIYDVTQSNLSETAIFMFLASIMIWSLGLIADMISRLNLRP